MQSEAEYNARERVGVKLLALMLDSTLIPNLPKRIVNGIDQFVMENALRFTESNDPAVIAHAGCLLIAEPAVPTKFKLAATQMVIDTMPILIDGIDRMKLDSPQRDLKKLQRENRKCAGHSLQSVEEYLTNILGRGEMGYNLAILREWRHTAINYRKQVNNLLGIEV